MSSNAIHYTSVIAVIWFPDTILYCPGQPDIWSCWTQIFLMKKTTSWYFCYVCQQQDSIRCQSYTQRSLLRHLLGLRIHIIGKCNSWFMNRYMSTHPIDDNPFCVIRWIDHAIDHAINLFIESNIFLHINSAQTVVITMALLGKCLGNEYMFAVGDTHCKSLLIVHVPCICTDIAYWTEHYIVWYISAELSLERFLLWRDSM